MSGGILPPDAGGDPSVAVTRRLTEMRLRMYHRGAWIRGQVMLGRASADETINCVLNCRPSRSALASRPRIRKTATTPTPFIAGWDAIRAGAEAAQSIPAGASGASAVLLASALENRKPTLQARTFTSGSLESGATPGCEAATPGSRVRTSPGARARTPPYGSIGSGARIRTATCSGSTSRPLRFGSRRRTSSVRIDVGALAEISTLAKPQMAPTKPSDSTPMVTAEP
ncbi:uncharacterized protein LOC144173580 [Haemaphysalis longicornis]